MADTTHGVLALVPLLEPVTLSPQQLGWMAGVIDLKGRIAYKNNAARRTRQTVLFVETKIWAVVDALSAMTKTSPDVKVAKPLSEFIRRGCMEHCPEKHVHVDKDGLTMPLVKRWTVTGAALVVVVHNLRPYLMVDRDYDTVVAEIVAHQRLTGSGAAAQLTAVSRLQHNGWAVPEPYATALRTYYPQLKLAPADVPAGVSFIDRDQYYAPAERADG
jgi:hypothetical protein